MNADDRNRARLVLRIADLLDREGRPFAGVVRDVARAVVEHRCEHGSGCPTCGEPVLQPARGRRRTYCSTRCRNAARYHRAEQSEIVRSAS